MPLLESFSSPPVSAITDRKIAEVITEYEKLRAKRDAEYEALYALEDKRADAVAADRKALAGALRANRDDPGDAHTRKLDAEILATKRRAEALDVAVGDASDEALAVIERQRAPWSAALEKREREARVEMAKAVDALAEARDVIAETKALQKWLDLIPRSALWPQGGYLTNVPALRGQNGAPLYFGAVVDALRELAEPPEPNPEPESQNRLLTPVPERAA